MASFLGGRFGSRFVEEKWSFSPQAHGLLHFVGLAGLGFLGYYIIKKIVKPKGSVILTERFTRPTATEIETQKTVKTYSEPVPVLKGFDIDPYKGMTIPAGQWGMYKVEQMLMKKIKKQPF